MGALGSGEMSVNVAMTVVRSNLMEEREMAEWVTLLGPLLAFTFGLDFFWHVLSRKYYKRTQLSHLGVPRRAQRNASVGAMRFNPAGWRVRV